MKGEMHLPFMIGINSCYVITGWNLGFYPYLDWSSSHSKFLTNHKMSTIWFRTVLKLPLSVLEGFLFLSTWFLLRRGAAKLSSIPIIFSMALGGARGFRGGGMLFCHLFRLPGGN